MFELGRTESETNDTPSLELLGLENGHCSLKESLSLPFPATSDVFPAWLVASTKSFASLVTCVLGLFTSHYATDKERERKC